MLAVGVAPLELSLGSDSRSNQPWYNGLVDWPVIGARRGVLALLHPSSRSNSKQLTMAKSSDNPEYEVPTHGIVSRPKAVLDSLPVDYRWEFTRRHPYYLLFWEPAHKYYQNPNRTDLERLLEQAALMMLQAIGVTSDPIDPGADPEELELSAIPKAWRNGALWPMTFRGLTGAMLKELPPESREAIGQLLVHSAHEGTDIQHVYRLFNEFSQLRDPSLDKMPTAPIIGVNVNAPMKTILEALEQQVQVWKDLAGITEHRRRDDKLPEYLKVWDLREGWEGDHYDIRKEKTLEDIANELRESFPTIANRYKSAFRYLIGHEYRPALWALVMGAFKTSRLLYPDHVSRCTGRRPWKSPGLRVVPETTLGAGHEPAEGHGGTFLERTALVEDMRESAELVMDLQDLLAKGWTDERIAAELELDHETLGDLLACLRRRRDDNI
jgi:hypothetical protein